MKRIPFARLASLVLSAVIFAALFTVALVATARFDPPGHATAGSPVPRLEEYRGREPAGIVAAPVGRALVLRPIRRAGPYHITTSGNDSNDGSAADSGHAFRHLQKGVDVLACGETAYVHAGTYSEVFAAGTKSCSSWGSPVTLQTYSTDYVHVTAPTSGTDTLGSISGTTSSNPADCPPDQTTPCYVMTPMYWVIQGFDFDASGGSFSKFGNAFTLFMTRHVKLIDNWFHGAANINIGANSDNGVHYSNTSFTGSPSYYPEWDRPQTDIQITGGKIYSAGRLCRTVDPGLGSASDICHDSVNHNGDGHAAYLSVKDSLVSGVEIYDNAGQSPQFTNSGARDDSNNVFANNYVHDNGAGVAYGPGHDTVAYNNIFANLGETNDGGVTFGGGAQTYGVGAGAGTCTDCKAFHNTFLRAGITLGGTVSFVAKNNLFLNMPSAPISEFGTFSSAIANNFSGDTTNDVNSDFTLKAGSGARNYGADLSSYSISGLSTDKNGATRDVSNHPDAGALVYGGVVSPLIITITPVSAVQGDTLNIAVVGNSAAVLTSPCSFSGSGITVNSTTITDDQHATTNVTVGAMAATGARNITCGNASKSSAFTVSASGSPVISSLSPNSGAQGAAPTVAIIGSSTHFNDGSLAISSTDCSSVLTFGTPTITDNTHVSVQITIDAAATVRACTVRFHTTTDGNVDASGAFTVISASSCSPGPGATIGPVAGQCVLGVSAGTTHTITSYDLPSPSSGAVGHTIISTASTYKDVTASVTTNMPVSSVTGFGGETWSLCGGGATNQITQTQAAIATATSSSRNATFNYGLGTPYYSQIFTAEFFGIKPSSPCDATGYATGTGSSVTVSTSSPSTVAGDLVYCAVQSAALTITSSDLSTVNRDTGYFDGYKIAGATGTQSCSFSFSSSAYYDAIIITLMPNTPTGTITLVNPSSCAQGASDCTIDLTGSDTHWNASCTPSFSNMGNLTVLSSVNHSATSHTVHIRMGYGAILGYRDVTMTCGTEVATATNGLLVTYTQQSRLQPFGLKF